MSKLKKIEDLKKKIINDKSLIFNKAKLVFGEGSLNSKIMFVGEAPGLEEDKQGRPFVGRSGKLLDKSIVDLNFKRSDFYITNIVKRRPDNNRDPLKGEINNYVKYLQEEIDIINPKIIVPLGRISASFFLNKIKISEDQGNFFKVNNKLIFPVFHPAAALRSTKILMKFKKSLIRLLT